MTVNVYEQYFKADHVCNGEKRKGVLVALVSDSCDGIIRYSVTATFFPHRDGNDFAVSYDDYFEKEIFSGKGRRSKKREAAFLESFRKDAGEMISGSGAKIYWDCPLREERRG